MIDHPSAHIIEALKLLSSLARAGTVEDAIGLLLQAVRPFGILYCAAWIGSDPELVDPRTNPISNWPEPWLESYIAEKKYLYDPVVARASNNSGSFFWHELKESLSPLAYKLLCDAQHQGMIDGFTVSLRSSGTSKTFLSLAGGFLAWNTLERAVVSALADGFILRTMCLQESDAQSLPRNLSPQERRILHLAATGLSDNEISQALKVHRGTVLAHWRRIRSKLSVLNRAHAVGTGIKLGEIVF